MAGRKQPIFLLSGPEVKRDPETCVSPETEVISRRVNPDCPVCIHQYLDYAGRVEQGECPPKPTKNAEAISRRQYRLS